MQTSARLSSVGTFNVCSNILTLSSTCLRLLRVSATLFCKKGLKEVPCLLGLIRAHIEYPAIITLSITVSRAKTTFRRLLWIYILLIVVPTIGATLLLA